MRPILLLSLAPFTFGHRLFQYARDSCNGQAVRDFRLAGLNSCQSLDYGVAQSVLVKIDNVNDNKYEVDFFSDDNCHGNIIRNVYNTNACVDIFLGPSHAMSVSTENATAVAQEEAQAQENSVPDPLLNYEDKTPALKRTTEKQLFTPIRKGVFIPVNSSNVDADGTYLDEQVSVFYPFTVEEAVELEYLRSEAYASAKPSSDGDDDVDVAPGDTSVRVML
ncbi:hypothetical protein BJX61DRAFT_38858 [Aspergillus egyptiacus]|nr:hypothetical protein BJX61DRAFT_38858 [Aspergillus egyptiacus]